ncbi:hypothetical protein D3C80_1500190 [compost metagenome]
MFSGEYDFLLQHRVSSAHRACEQAELFFELQDTQHGFINQGFIDKPFLHQLRQMMQIAGCHHVDIHTGPDRFEGRFLIILCRTMRDHFLDGCPI